MNEAPVAIPRNLPSPRQYRAMRELLLSPCTVRQLQISAGGNGIPQLIASLRAKGLLIKTVFSTGKDRDGRTTRFGTYKLLPESVELAFQLLAMESKR